MSVFFDKGNYINAGRHPRVPSGIPPIASIPGMHHSLQILRRISAQSPCHYLPKDVSLRKAIAPWSIGP